MTNIKTIAYDLDFLKNKFQFSDEDMTKVPQNPFTYLRQAFKDTALRASQYKMLYKVIYTKKLLKTCRLVETDTCERCNEQVEDFKPLLWDCRYSANIWKEVEKQITERYEINIELKYHSIIMGVRQADYKNHEAINTITMAIKKRICYKDRLTCHDAKNIKNIIENRIKTEKYIEKKNGKTISKWDTRR